MKIITNSVYEFITSDPKKKIGYVDRVITARRLTEKEAKNARSQKKEIQRSSRPIVQCLKLGSYLTIQLMFIILKLFKFLKLSNFA